MNKKVLRKYIEENGEEDIYYIPSILFEKQLTEDDKRHFPNLVDVLLSSKEITKGFYHNERITHSNNMITYKKITERFNLRKLSSMEDNGEYVVGINENNNYLYFDSNRRIITVNNTIFSINKLFQHLTFRGVEIYKVLGKGLLSDFLPFILHKTDEDLFFEEVGNFIGQNIKNEKIIQVTIEELIGGVNLESKKINISNETTLKIISNSLYYKYHYIYEHIKNIYTSSHEKFFRTVYLHLFVEKCQVVKGLSLKLLRNSDKSTRRIPSNILLASIRVFRYLDIIDTILTYPVMTDELFYRIMSNIYENNSPAIPIEDDKSIKVDTFMKNHLIEFSMFIKNYIVILRKIEEGKICSVLENILYLFMTNDENSAEEIIDILGLVPPKNYEYDAFVYLSENLDFLFDYFYSIEYPVDTIGKFRIYINSIYNSKPILYRKTDKYILRVLFKDMEVFYKNSSSLEKLAEEYKNGGKIIFLPLKNRKCNPKFDLDGNDLDDETYNVFAIGNEDIYKCYDFETVMNMMKTRGNLSYEFKDIGGGILRYKKMNEDMADSLIMLVDYTNYKDKGEFIEIISDAIEYERGAYKRYFDKLTQSERSLLKDFFLGLFYIGMLTRRWNPDDKEYPMEEEGTLHGDRDISEDAMSVILTRNYELFREHILDHLTRNIRKFLNSIKCVTKHGEEIEQETIYSGGRILELIRKTFDEKDYDKVACQRIASNAFITSSDHYLREYFNYQIPDFDITKMKTII